MAAKHSRCLVIDTDVLRSAGGEQATDVRAKLCRDLLTTVLTVCHRMVLTTALTAEWNRHQSRFARNWRVQMIARKKVCAITASENAALRAKIGQATANVQDKNAMLKDCHLIEAAIAADQIIVSLDETARGLFDLSAERVGELRVVAWVNPCKTEDGCSSWLQEGAPLEKHRQLGHKPS